MAVTFDPEGRALGPTDPLSVSVSRSHRVAHVAVAGVLDCSTALGLPQWGERLLAGFLCRRMVIDLTGVTFVDLQGLRAIDQLVAHVAARTPVDVAPGTALVRLRTALQRAVR